MASLRGRWQPAADSCRAAQRGVMDARAAARAHAFGPLGSVRAQPHEPKSLVGSARALWQASRSAGPTARSQEIRSRALSGLRVPLRVEALAIVRRLPVERSDLAVAFRLCAHRRQQRVEIGLL